MGSVTKRKLLLAALCCVVIAVIVLLVVFPTNGQLISTPSTHRNIEYLTLESRYLAPDLSVKFAALDVAVNTMQITLTAPKGARDIINKLAITIDGSKLDAFDVIYDSTFKCLYIHIIIKDIGLSFDEIAVTYNDNSVIIGK